MRATALWESIRHHETAAFSVEGSRRHCVVLSNYTASYRVWGQGQPIVLVPGLAGGMGLLAPLAAQLAQHGLQAIALQLRGEENCFALRRSGDLADHVTDLEEFLDALGLENPLMLGVSFGGALAAHVALRRPGRLAGLILQGTDVRFRKSLLRIIAGRVLDQFPLPAHNAFINQFFSLLFGGRPRDRELFDFVTSQCWKTDQAVIAHRFRLAEKVNLSDLLPCLNLPTQVIWGERDLLVTPRGLDDLTQRLTDVELRRIEGAGHLAFVTHADRMAAAVASFARAQELVVE